MRRARAEHALLRPGRVAARVHAQHIAARAIEPAFDKPFSGNDYDAEDSGYTVGVQFQRQIAGALASWLRAGGLYNHIEVANPEGSIVADSGHELGWEVGVGMRVPTGSRLALIPGARYRAFSGNLDLGAGREPVDLSYLAVELGVSWSFGGRAVILASRAVF